MRMSNVFQKNKIDVTIFLQLVRADFQDLGIDALRDRKRLENLQKLLKNKMSNIFVSFHQLGSLEYYLFMYTL